MMSKIVLHITLSALMASDVFAQSAPSRPSQESYLAGQLGLLHPGCSKPILRKVAGPKPVPLNDLGYHANINGPKGEVGVTAGVWKNRIVGRYGRPSFLVELPPSCPVKTALIYSDRVPFRFHEDVSCVLSSKDRPNAQFVMMGQADATTDCKDRHFVGHMMVVSILQDRDAVIVSGGMYNSY